ncbi:hypothetical protein T492DRAFT_925334 [Pavlovales sp. CCMP2436]|nr:hypothetical protein T492DRAFT_925334 [Pavlovales sp. CCMP2436]
MLVFLVLALVVVAQRTVGRVSLDYISRALLARGLLLVKRARPRCRPRGWPSMPGWPRWLRMPGWPLGEGLLARCTQPRRPRAGAACCGEARKAGFGEARAAAHNARLPSVSVNCHWLHRVAEPRRAAAYHHAAELPRDLQKELKSVNSIV